MSVLRADEIAAAVGGELLNAAPDLVFRDYHFDSRELADGGLFFALAGERNDGHSFLAEVAAKPGAGAVVRRSHDGPLPAMPLIRVDDTKAAYERLARHVRARFDRVRYVGITGSVGKTTTREFAAHILSGRFRVHRPQGNWNNWQGLPFALLKMPEDTEVAVFELAMSSPGLGEIDHLADILRPDIAALISACPVHLEFLHTIENVARGKMEIMNYLAADGVALLNGDADLVFRFSRNRDGHRIYFGRNGLRNDVVLKDVVQSCEQTRLVVGFFGIDETFVSPPLTAAQVENLFAAIVIAWQAGMKHREIRESLDGLQPVPGRGVILEHDGVTLVDDTYNANPEAVKKLLAWGAHTFPGVRVAVLGDMLELGEKELLFHAEIGRLVAGLGYDLLVTVGARSHSTASAARRAGLAQESVVSFEQPEEAGAWLRGHVHPGSAVLFKASRGIALERAIAAFKGEPFRSH